MIKEEASLIAEKDFPTHRLTVKIGKDSNNRDKIKEFFFNANEANAIAEKMCKSSEQFFIFGKGTNYVQAYPKHGAVLEALTKSEIRKRHWQYFERLLRIKKDNEDEKVSKMKKDEDIWRKNNPEKWEEIYKKAIDLVDKDNEERSFFGMLSNERKMSLYKSQASIILRNYIQNEPKRSFNKKNDKRK